MRLNTSHLPNSRTTRLVTMSFIGIGGLLTLLKKHERMKNEITESPIVRNLPVLGL